jgi:hypothetical protein
MRRRALALALHTGYCAVAALGGLTGGCAESPLRAAAPSAPRHASAGDDGDRCRIAANQESPLVTEWPASEKANLQARLSEGGIAVAYSGCEMRLLQQCHVSGRYAWQRTTPATDVIQIRNADELYAKLPLGAVGLEGELASSGRLAIETTVSGQLNLRGDSKPVLEFSGNCEGATHIVAALSVGAFTLKSGGESSAKGSAGILVADAHASTSSSESVMREAGDRSSCSAGDEEKPPLQCSSPIQVFLWRMPAGSLDSRAGQSGALPASAPVPPPQGSIEAHFMTTDANSSWQVVSNGQPVCVTPCSRWAVPGEAFLMRGANGRPSIQVPNLRDYSAGEAVDVRAHGRKTGLLAVGITATSLGGMGEVTGIALTSVGFGEGDATMRDAGLITAAASLGLLIPGILWISGSSPYAEVVQPQAGLARDHQTDVSVSVGPGTVFGRF